MATSDKKKIGKGQNQPAETHHYDFSVMKPFVKFGIGAMGAIAHTLIGIVKAIPKPHDDGDKKAGRDKIIKI